MLRKQMWEAQSHWDWEARSHGDSVDSGLHSSRPQNKTSQQQQESNSWNTFWMSTLNIHP